MYLVFYMVKLTIMSKDLISGKYSNLSLNLAIIDRKEEWKAEKIPDGCWYCKKYQYFIK